MNDSEAIEAAKLLSIAAEAFSRKGDYHAAYRVFEAYSRWYKAYEKISTVPLGALGRP